MEFKESNKTQKVKCHHCGEVYLQQIENQLYGCREKEYDVCPYCGKANGSSMSVEYFNEVITE